MARNTYQAHRLSLSRIRFTLTERVPALTLWVSAGLLLVAAVSVLRQFVAQLVGILVSPVPAATVFHEEGFYFLTVARNIAAGLGPTADGTSLTSGFQPLWTGLLSIAYALANLFGGEGLIYALALMLLVLVAALLLAGCAARAISKSPSPFLFIAAVAIFANDLRLLRLATSALETTIYTCCLFWLLILWARNPLALKGAKFSPQDRSWSIWFGLALGLACLARIDAVFFGIAYLAALTLKTGLTKRWALAAAVIGGISFVLLASWLAYPLFVHGTPIPQSGTATSGGIYPAIGLRDQLMSVLSVLASYPLTSSANVLREVGLGSGLIIGAGLLAFGLLLLLTYRLREQSKLELLIPHAVGSILIVGFYAAFSHTPWRFEAYFMPAAMLVLMLLTLLVHAAWRQLKPRLIVPAAALLIVGFGLLHAYLWVTRPVPEGDWITPGLLWLVEKQFDSPVHMFQTGRAGYLFQEKIVNLDGKMNYAALTANREKRLLEYLIENDAKIVFDSNEFPERFLPLYPEWKTYFADRSGDMSPPQGWFVHVRNTPASGSR